jgi:hypothetical protein
MSDAGNYSEHRQDRTSPTLLRNDVDERNDERSQSHPNRPNIVPTGDSTDVSRSFTSDRTGQALPPVRSTLSNKTLPTPPSLPARPSAALRLDPAAPRVPTSSSAGGRRPVNFRPRSRSRTPERYRDRSYLPPSSHRYAGRRTPSPPPLSSSTNSNRRATEPRDRDRESRLRELDQELDRYRQGDGKSSPQPRSDQRYGNSNSNSRVEQEDGASHRRGRDRDPHSAKYPQSSHRESPSARSRSPGPRIYRAYSPSPVKRRRLPSPYTGRSGTEREEYTYQDRRARSPLTPPLPSISSDFKKNDGNTTASLSLHERIFGTNSNKEDKVSFVKQEPVQQEQPSAKRVKEEERESVEVDRYYRDRQTEPTLSSPPTKRRKVELEEGRARQPVESRPLIPTGPRATRPTASIPTGPRSSIVQPPRNNYNNTRFGNNAFFGQPSAYGRNGAPGLDTDDMSGRGRGGPGGKNGAGGGKKSRNTSRGSAGGRAAKGLGMTRQQELLPQLSGPMRTRDQIMQEFGMGGKLDVKKAWVENPKSPVANWFGAGKGNGSVPYEMEKGMLDGKQIYR